MWVWIHSLFVFLSQISVIKYENNTNVNVDEQRPRLEPIQEESEQEDNLKRSESGEREEEDFQVQAGVETEEVTAEETEEEDEDEELRVLRPSRPSRHSLSLRRRRSANDHREELERFFVSDSKDEATPPKQARLGHERRSSSSELRMKVSIFCRSDA